ncbi:hypothetical protein [Candidatus Legionella polyplacis]|uniref:ATP synthase epsilon chain n=1 Tax=Candidatus Legionella polyplacis TaxID=2005262 RepID=A0ABZ2GW42_9GAMM
MKKAIKFSLISTEKEIFSGIVKMVVIKSVLGDIGIMPGHHPLLAILKNRSTVKLFFSNGNIKEYILDSMRGLVEVQPYRVIILVDTILDHCFRHFTQDLLNDIRFIESLDLNIGVINFYKINKNEYMKNEDVVNLLNYCFDVKKLSMLKIGMSIMNFNKSDKFIRIK